MQIRDFPSGRIETRGQIAVMHSRVFRRDAPGIWRFLIAVDSKLGVDIWTYLSQGDIDQLQEDEAILSVAAAKIRGLARADPECRLRDGRLLSDVDTRYLFAEPQ